MKRPRELDLAWIASVTGARSARRAERVQSLWSGYGERVRVALEGAAMETVIVKWVAPPSRAKDDAAHARKRRSYDVERAFYRRFAPRCDASCRVPGLLGSRARDDEQLFVLEDLDAAGFVERRSSPGGAAMEACLAWLASFHARFLGVAPDGLWSAGTYWNLAMRQDELAAIEHPALRDAAAALDAKLASCTHRTILHGDAKPANFLFTRGESAVAAVDFQYPGGGCGTRDVAYLLSGEPDEARMLDTYFAYLRRALGPDVDGAALETEWRALYPIACADFYRFLAGWAPAQYRHDVHAQRTVREVLARL